MSVWRAVQEKDLLIFETTTVRLSWKINDQSMSFIGMHRVADGKGFSFGSGAPFWSLDIRDQHGYRFPADGTEYSSFSYQTGDSLVLKWSGLAEGHVDVVLTCTAAQIRPRTSWRMRITNRNSALTVWNITFPALPDVIGPAGSHHDDILITSEGFGCAIPDPSAQKRDAVWSRFRYPNNVVSMPYCALQNSGVGLYVGAHDPACLRKEFAYTPAETGSGTPLEGQPAESIGSQPLSIMIPAPDSGRAQPSVQLDYDTVLALFEGDWYDAALLQRDWVQTLPRAAATVAGRTDIPAWAKTLPLWVRCDVAPHAGRTVTDDDYRRLADLLLSFKNEMDCELGAHMYQWHTHPFDLIYPEYTPRPGLKGFVASLQSNGIHAMPYINGRIFDVDALSWEADKARQWSCKEAGAKCNPHVERVIFETYGSATPLAVMCSATEYWQDKIASVVERLVKELDVDAVYIDQIGAAWSELCADPAHGHQLRNGSWWVEGYYTMIRKMQERLADVNKTVLLTTESNADPYTHLLGMLMVNSHRNYIVPAFPTVYGSSAYLFGRSERVTNRDAFRLMTFQNVLWGCQPGWFGLDEIRRLMSAEYSDELTVVKRSAALFSKIQPFVHGGYMSRPPRNEADSVHKNIVWQFGGTWPEKVDTICTAAWELDGQTISVIANTHSAEQKVIIPFSAPDPAVWWTPGSEGIVSFNEGKAIVSLPPFSAITLTA